MGCERTIEEHLRGFLVEFNVSDETLKSVLWQAGVSPGMPLSSLNEEDVDRAVAWLYIWALNLLPYARNNTKDSDGGWEHTEGGYQLLAGDRKRLLSLLRMYWRRWRWPWLEEILDDSVSARVVVYNL